ncbi:MAG: hypothetical protein V4614_14890 [Pseudomonadota bacterium]
MQLTDYWFARLVICGHVLSRFFIVAADPQTRMHELVTASGPAGWCVMTCLAVLAFIGLIDIAVNDFMPSHVGFRWIYNRRHLLYSAITMNLLLISAVLAKEGWSPVLFSFWGDAAFCGAVVFLEMFPRHRKRAAA